MKRKLNKAQAERSHFKYRLRERYGIKINRFTYRDMVDSIKTHHSTCLLIQSNTRTVHSVAVQLDDTHDPRNLLVPHNNGLVNVLVVYDKLRGEIITALPPNLTVDDIRKYNGD